MKFAVLHKQNTASTSAAVVALGSAATGFRTIAQAIAAGELAQGDQTTFMVRDAAGKFEFSLFTVTDANTLTRVAVRASSNGGSAETFGTGATVSNMPDGAWLSQLYGAADAVDVTGLQTLSSLADTDSVLVLRGSDIYRALGSVLKSYVGGTSAPAATVSSVSVSPSAPSVAGGATQTFTASVTGTNSPAQTVTWTASAGSITSGGVFTAPAATGSAQTITITARSTVDTTKTGTATATVPATGTPTPTVSSVSVSPSAPSVTGGSTQQFTATVTGANSPSQGVNWTASAGTINSSGLFTAPAATGSAQTITVTATSQLDGTKSGTATVTVPAAAAQTAYTITGYAGNTIKTAYDVSSNTTQVYSGQRQVNINWLGTNTNYPQYFTINPVPPALKVGWGTSSTVPPTESPADFQNGLRTIAPGATLGLGGESILWATQGSGDGVSPNGDGTKFYLWFKPSDGAAFCFNAATGLALTNA